MSVKVTLFFGEDRYSWSEAHYYLNATTFPDATAPALALAAKRSACLGRNASLAGVRLSLVPANRLVRDLDSALWPESGAWPADPTNLEFSADRAYSALLVRVFGTISSKNLYFAGVPDGVIQTVPGSRKGFILSDPFDAAFNKFMNFIAPATGTSGWGFLSRVSAGKQAATALVTSNVFPATLGVQVATQLGAPAGGGGIVPVNVGQDVYLTGWRRKNTGSPGLSGAWQVVGIIPPATGPGPYQYFLGESGNVDPLNFKALGAIGPLTFQAINYQDWAPQKAVSRKRGASFDKPVGRSKTRR